MEVARIFLKPLKAIHSAGLGLLAQLVVPGGRFNQKTHHPRSECDGLPREGLRKTDYGLLAQLVEHIVHIDGVTGSSPVQTTKIPPDKGGFLMHIS